MTLKIKFFRSEIFSEHEDIELGRCFHKHLGISCTNAWDTSEYFWNNYRPRPLAPGLPSSWDNLDWDKIPQKIKEHGITLHSNKYMPYQQITRKGLILIR